MKKIFFEIVHYPKKWISYNIILQEKVTGKPNEPPQETLSGGT